MTSFVPLLNISKKALSHGGNLLSLLRQQKKHSGQNRKEWIDLSSAVNRQPWPIPSIPDFLWHELPDTNTLIAAASDYYGCTNLVPIAGTQQAIEALPTLLQPTMLETDKQPIKPIVLVPNIGYQEHAFAWEKWGYNVQTYDIKNHTVIAQSELMTRPWHILVLIQPNNPSTHSVAHSDIESLIHLAQQRQGYIIIDEAFIDPTIHDSTLTLTSHNMICSNQDWPESLIILKSVGKFFGLPGARVGFLFSSPQVLNKISLVVGPWPISTPAVWLVTQALRDTHWQVNARADLLQRQQRFNVELLPLLKTLFVHGDTQEWHASSLFFTVMSEEVEKIFTQLQALKIHTRLGEGWLRFALPSNAEFDLIKLRLKNDIALPSSEKKQEAKI